MARFASAACQLVSCGPDRLGPGRQSKAQRHSGPSAQSERLPQSVGGELRLRCSLLDKTHLSCAAALGYRLRRCAGDLLHGGVAAPQELFFRFSWPGAAGVLLPLLGPRRKAFLMCCTAAPHDLFSSLRFIESEILGPCMNPSSCIADSIKRLYSDDFEPCASNVHIPAVPLNVCIMWGRSEKYLSRTGG
jgi:hypothetical protein